MPVSNQWRPGCPNGSRVRSGRHRTERSALYARASREISSVRRHSWRALPGSFHEANCKERVVSIRKSRSGAHSRSEHKADEDAWEPSQAAGIAYRVSAHLPGKIEETRVKSRAVYRTTSKPCSFA